MAKRFSCFFLLLLISIGCLSQQTKTLQATKIDNPPTIDGVLDDAVWQTLPKYDDFNMFEPGNEGTIAEGYQTEVQFAYDDDAVYVAAYLHHPNPSEMLKQFSQRDEVFVQADYFAVALNTYNDGINETRFYVTSAGTIGDSRVNLNNQDFGYDVVFQGQISYDDHAWYAEFKIPYNALRFPESDIQNWSVNFYRRLTKENETHTWNFINNTKGSQTQYNALVTGVRNIQPPLRLTLFPFAQGVVSQFDGETETSVSAGMDIKYGLTDSFTLDATLIPDFGQVAFDEVELNLGPFEQTFGENRQFFTEGIDLFTKAGIFFSRRVGGAPSGDAGELSENEEVFEFPDRVNLLNALKISGRTQSELGVGFFNAVTEETFATIRDTINQNQRLVLVEPLSNYNIFVLDQQFNNNSTVSLINTNVTREGEFRDANSTAIAFDVADRGNNFRTAGRAIMSNVSEATSNRTGFRSEFDIFKIKGKFRYRVGHDFANTTFDINDLGLNFRNNYNNFGAGISYQIFEPTKYFNSYRVEFNVRHRRLYRPSVQTENNFSAELFMVQRNRIAYGINASFNTDLDDYFEPRVPGKFVTFSENIGGRTWISTDYRKKFAFDAGIGYRNYLADPQRNLFFDFSPRYRFSNRLLMVLRSDFSFRDKNFGYVDNTDVEVFLGQRDITEIENSITASYNFDPFKAIDLRFRHFWSTADYSENVFFVLNDDGSRTLTEYDTSENDPNKNFNIWNLDLSFRWRFAPGSEATLLYRNQIFNVDELSTLGYSESLSNLFDQPQQNTLSLRITYFLDYNNLRSFLKGNS
ncbi:MAG: hydrolase [Flavobacteriaceae bacterium]|nr:hydrolase [Flavobacteriaceae bacterium]